MRTHTLNTEQKTKYGKYIHLQNEQHSDTGSDYYLRISEWTNKQGEKFIESHKAGTLTDASDLVNIRAVYNSDCYCCYAGISHTQEKHTRALKYHKVASKWYATRDEFNKSLKAEGLI